MVLEHGGEILSYETNGCGRKGFVCVFGVARVVRVLAAVPMMDHSYFTVRRVFVAAYFRMLS